MRFVAAEGFQRFLQGGWLEVDPENGTGNIKELPLYGYPNYNKQSVRSDELFTPARISAWCDFMIKSESTDRGLTFQMPRGLYI